MTFFYSCKIRSLFWPDMLLILRRLTDTLTFPVTHGVCDLAKLIFEQDRFLTILNYALGREESLLSVLIDPSLLLIHIIDRLHVIREPVVLASVPWDQEFVYYDGATCSSGIRISCCILKLSFYGREKARVSQLVPVVVEHLSLLI